MGAPRARGRADEPGLDVGLEPLAEPDAVQAVGDDGGLRGRGEDAIRVADCRVVVGGVTLHWGERRKSDGPRGGGVYPRQRGQYLGARSEGYALDAIMEAMKDDDPSPFLRTVAFVATSSALALSPFRSWWYPIIDSF